MYVCKRSTERLTVQRGLTERCNQKRAYESNGFPVIRHNYICYPVTSIIITGQTGLTPGPVTVVQKHSHEISGNITYMLTIYHDNDYFQSIRTVNMMKMENILTFVNRRVSNFKTLSCT